MSVSKVKNIVLLILLVTNLFLLGQVALSERRAAEYQETALLAAINILEDSGISAPRERIPGGAMPFPQSFERDRVGEAALARFLLGDALEVDAAGGAALGIYRSAAGSLRLFADGGLEATFAPGVHTAAQSSPETHALQLLKDIGFDGQVIALAAVGNTTTVTVRQTQGTWQIFSCALRCTYVGDSLTGISGRRMAGTPAVAEDTRMTMATLLVRLRNEIRERGDVCSEILSMEPGYELVSAFTGPNRLVPTLLVRVDGNRQYFLNMKTGELQPV